MRPITALQSTKDKLLDPKRWTRGALARDSTGQEVPPNDPTACQWCLEGALCSLLPTPTGPDGLSRLEICGGGGVDVAFQYLTQACKDRGYASLSEFNDSSDTKHADIIGLLDATMDVVEDGMKEITVDDQTFLVPEDYEVCAECGFDHQYESPEAQAVHRQRAAEDFDRPEK